MRKLALILCTHATCAWVGAQTVLYVHSNPPVDPDGGGPFHRSLDCRLDVDGDGLRDCLVGIQENYLSHTGSGFVVVSGADASEIQRGYGPAHSGFGDFVALIEDVTGDGLGDVLASGHTGSQSGLWYGWVACVEGVVNRRFWSREGEETDDQLGSGLTVMSDVDGDGFSDFAVASRYDVHVCSGATGQTIYKIPDPGVQRLGIRAATIGDQDGDQVSDLLLYANGWSGVPAGVDGCVVVCSGSDGSVLRVHYGDFDDDYAHSLTGIGDITGDGVPEYVVGAHKDSQAWHVGGMVYVYEGGTGDLLRVHQGSAPFQLLGVWVAPAGDLDRDGTPDYLLGDHLHWPGSPSFGRMHVMSGATGEKLFHYQLNHVAALGQATSVGDLNGDGYDDLALSVHDWTDPSGIDHVVFLAVNGEIGIRHCSPAAPNSTGHPASLTVRGSPSVDLDWLKLEAQGMPSAELHFFLKGTVLQQWTPPGTGVNLCVGGQIHRLSGPRVSSQSGSSEYRVRQGDFGLPGETAIFQAWYRDGVLGTSSSTDAISLLFH